MPALPSVPNYIKSVVDWTIEGDPMGQTINYWQKSGGGGSIADMNSIAAAIATSFGNRLKALYLASTSVTGCSAIDLSSPTANSGLDNTTTAGTRAGSRLSPGTAVVNVHHIARRYRGGHPRNYLPLGASADVVSAGTWDPTFITAVNTAWANIVTDVLGSHGSTTLISLSNVSYYGPPNRTITGSTGRVKTVSTVRTVPLTDVITASAASAKIGSQRRRNRNA